MANGKVIPEIQSNFMRGQDASINPSLIGDGYFSSGVNLSTYRGSLTPRLRSRSLVLDFTEVGSIEKPGHTPVSFKDIFLLGNYQGSIPYSIGPDYYEIVIISGYLFMVSHRTNKVTVLNPKDRLSPYAARLNWSPAAKYLVVYDFPDRPLIIEGLEVRRSDPSKYEVPVSVMGAYNQNRLFIANAANEFTAGDPVGSLQVPDAPITFTEISMNNAPYVGQLFQLSTNYNNDPITAMSFLQVADSSTGIGPLEVSTANAVWAYGTQNPRSNWTQGQFGSSLLFNTGVVSNQATLNVNTDMFFIAPDCTLRSLSMSRNEQGRWACTPMSKEVSNYFYSRDPSLVKYSFMGYFRNKIFVSVNPYLVKTNPVYSPGVPYETVFGGFVVLETDNVSGLTRQAEPSWAGLWTGIRPMGCSTNNNRFFVVGKENGLNTIYEIQNKIGADYRNYVKKPYTSIIYTKAFTTQDASVNKFIHSVDLGFQNVSGRLKVRVSYRPLHLNYFTEWRTLVQDFPTCPPLGSDALLKGGAPQSVLNMPLGGVDDMECDLFERTPQAAYKQVQLKIEIQADYWELLYIKMRGRIIDEDVTDQFCGVAPKILAKECVDDWRSPYGDG